MKTYKIKLPKKDKYVNLIIGGKEYAVTLYLSAGDVFSLVGYFNSDKHKYNVAVATIIEKHILPNHPEKSLVDMIAADDTTLQTYISEIVTEETDFKEFYEKHQDESDCCRRFVYAVNDVWKEQTERFKMTVARSTDLLGGLTDITYIIANAIDEINQQIEAALSVIQIPHISEERKEELCKAYEQWGTFGWTANPRARVSLYNQIPESQREANELAMADCRDKDMLALFADTKKLKKIKKEDFEEAIVDYQQKRYTSCAMMLFSLLDAKLIRMQKKSDINPKTKQRDSGIRAAENIKRRIEREQNIDEKLFLLLSYKNLFACLSVFFAKGNDFKVQPELANRNFVSHGMLTKRVRKRDCVQLFLLYYNFLEFFETLNSE